MAVTLKAIWNEDIPSTLYAYNNGNQYSDVTGGWVFELLDCGTGDYSISPSIYLKTTSDSSCYHTIAYRTKNKVPTQNYKKLIANVTAITYSNGGCKTGNFIQANLSTEHSRLSYSGGAQMRLTSTGTATLDVSEVNEPTYISVYVYGNCFKTSSITVSSIYLTN